MATPTAATLVVEIGEGKVTYRVLHKGRGEVSRATVEATTSGSARLEVPNLPALLGKEAAPPEKKKVAKKKPSVSYSPPEPEVTSESKSD